MQFICIMLVTFGSCVILYGIRRYYRFFIGFRTRTELRNPPRDRIHAACLIIMIIFFIGYMCNLIFSIFKNNQVQDLLIAVIFFFGSLFVFAMITTTRRMLFAIMEKEELIMAKEAAEKACGSKTGFLSRMCREMHTPMKAIIGMTAVGKSAADIERKDYSFDKIETASKHLLGVINDVLDMLKIETNTLDLNFTFFSLDKMLAKIVNAINDQINEKKQRFVLSVGKDLPEKIYADEKRLSQVLLILLENAVKFTPEYGNISLQIRKRGECHDFYDIQFEIRDSGECIPFGQHERLFAPYEQPDADIPRRYGGAGLGLAISRSLVEMMNGEIRVIPGEGEGVCFVVNIRVKKHSSHEIIEKLTIYKKAQVK